MPEQKESMRSFYELLVEDIMDKRFWDLPVIEKNAGLDKVLAILCGKDHIWIVESEGSRKVVGVITEHDVLNIFAPKHFPFYGFGMPDLTSVFHGTAKTAEDIMSSKLIKCSLRTTVKQALELMVVNRIRRLPVTDNDTLYGEITLRNILIKYCVMSEGSV